MVISGVRNECVPLKGLIVMSVQTVREYLKQFGVENRIMEFNESSATVELAAAVVGVIPARIAKTLSFKDPSGEAFLIIAAGDVRIDNRRFKDRFGFKAKMLSADEVPKLTGHPVGGVCPFALKPEVRVFLDESLKRFDTVYPAVGSPSSAIELSCDELFKCSGAEGWVDVCKLFGTEED